MSVDWHTSPSWVSLDTFPQDATIHKRMMFVAIDIVHHPQYLYRSPLIPIQTSYREGATIPGLTDSIEMLYLDSGVRVFHPLAFGSHYSPTITYHHITL